MFVIKNNKIRISVRSLVEFLCRKGDIDTRYSYSAQDKDAMLKGTKMHKKIQRSMGAEYDSEVLLRLSIFINVGDSIVSNDIINDRGISSDSIDGRDISSDSITDRGIGSDGINGRDISNDSINGSVINSGDIKQENTSIMNDNATTVYTKVYCDEIDSISNEEDEDNVYEIIIEGRADGIMHEGEIDVVDEIKSTYKDLRYITEPDEVHLAQAKCYAYMLAIKNDARQTAVTMTYCNLDDESIKRFRYDYDMADLTQWFNKLMLDLKQWISLQVISEKIRDMSLEKLEFPFEYREGQRKLVVSVYKSISDKKKIFLQAPTGVGKTMSTIFPALKSMGEGKFKKLFYLTAKTITRTVAIEAFRILRDNGSKVRSIILTAKDKICFCEKKNCNPVDCEYAKGHYDRVNSAVYDMIMHEYIITREVIEKYSRSYCVCPFEMSLDASYWCDAIVCDYNYVFDPNAHLKRFFDDASHNVENYVYLIDEAHNLVERGRDMFSARIVKEDIMQAAKMIKNIDRRLSNALAKCNKNLLELKRECSDFEVIQSCGALSISLLRLQSEFERFVEEYRDFSESDFLQELYFNIRHFNNMSENVDENYVIYTAYDVDGQFYIKLFCINPSVNLSNVIEGSAGTVFFSATLLPVNYYKSLLSVTSDEDYAIYTESPFLQSNRMIVASRDVTSRYVRRNTTEYRKIIEYICRITLAKEGNYMVFFPSYKYLRDVYCVIEHIIQNESTTKIANMLLNIEFILQDIDMSESERENFLNKFLNARETEGIENSDKKSFVGMCVLGGVFSEGIDLTEDALIGAIIVGTGLPMVCDEREIVKNYYNKRNNQGYEYAYIYPGINKVLQAAGRVIRTDKDRGIIALLDNRILEHTYDYLIPREWNDMYMVNVNNIEGLVKEFWDTQK